MSLSRYSFESATYADDALVVLDRINEFETTTNAEESLDALDIMNRVEELEERKVEPS